MAMVGESGSENSGSEERETYGGDSGAEDDEDEVLWWVCLGSEGGMKVRATFRTGEGWEVLVVEGGISEVVKIGCEERGLEEAIRGLEVTGGTDLPVEIFRGAEDLLPEVSPSLAFFA